MLARVVCSKCYRDLKIKLINVESLGVVIVVESCRGPECLSKHPEEDVKYEKHLSDLFTVESATDYFMGGEI